MRQLKTTDAVCRGCGTRSLHGHRRIDDWLTRGTRDDEAGKSGLTLRRECTLGERSDEHQR